MTRQEKVRDHQRSTWSILLAALIALSLAATLFIGAGNATSTAQTNMRAVLDAVSNESTAVTNHFLAGSQTAATVAVSMSVHSSLEVNEERTLFTSLVAATPQIDSVYIGYPDGRFNFVARSLNDRAAFRFHQMASPDQRTKVTYVDDQMNTVETDFIDAGTFDPRERPWYEAIAQGTSTNWTDPYLFSSSQQLGVTYSAGVYDDAGELVAVVGVDVTLDELVAFLKERRPSENGSALVVNQNGTILASSETNVADLKRDPEADASLTPATWARILIAEASQAREQPVSKQFQIDDRWGNLRSVGATGNWYLLVEAPAADFGAQSPRILSGRTAALIATSLLAGLVMLVLLSFAERRLAKLKNMATIDELTAVWNRAGIFGELTPLLANPDKTEPVIIAILDLDHFKAINDSYGHGVGDRTLAEVGRRVAEVANRHGMQAGRLGGDEFVVFGTRTSGQPHAPIWNEVLETIQTVSWIGSSKVNLSASIGVAEMDGTKVLTVTDALQIADRALYEGKRSGGSQVNIARPFAHTVDAINLADPEVTDLTFADATT